MYLRQLNWCLKQILLDVALVVLLTTTYYGG